MSENELLAKAIAFAADKHKDQKRKDGTPYIYHPLEVAQLVKDAGYGISYQVVAVLHDVLEDTDATEEQIQEYGSDIFEAVKLLTRGEDAKEEEYVAAILNNQMATVVKNADKIHNMRDVGCCQETAWAKRYVEKVRKYYEGKFSQELDHAIADAKEVLTKK